MDLTFQAPMQYCSLHWTLPPSPVTSGTGCCFCSVSASSFLLEVFLHSSPVACWAPTCDLSVSCLLPFHTVLGVLKARILKWFAIPFSSDHILSDLSTMTCPSWVALHGMAHSFIELDKAYSVKISLLLCIPKVGFKPWTCIESFLFLLFWSCVGFLYTKFQFDLDEKLNNFQMHNRSRGGIAD